MQVKVFISGYLNMTLLLEQHQPNGQRIQTSLFVFSVQKINGCFQRTSMFEEFKSARLKGIKSMLNFLSKSTSYLYINVWSHLAQLVKTSVGHIDI